VPRGLLLSNKQNVGFGRANNQLLAHLKGKYALLLNTDAFVRRLPAKPLDYMDAHPECGVLGCAWRGAMATCNPVVATSPAQCVRGAPGWALLPRLKMVDEVNWDHASVRECDWLPGCFYLVRREVLDKVGLFDPRYFLYYEEVDHCKRVKEAGWKVVFYPHTTVVHIGGESSKSVAELERPADRSRPTRSKASCCTFASITGWRGLPACCW
jgi:GT2 family glycosyltransferase